MFQPAAFVIIGGSALFALVISSGKNFMFILKNIGSIFKPSLASKQNYLTLLMLLYNLFTKTQKEGMLSLERHVDAPEKSDIFKKYGAVSSDPRIRLFITENLRILLSGGTAAQLDTLIEIDIETQHAEALYPSSIIAKTADSLPGLGIVAAVLGVALAMTKIAAPPAVLGHTVAAALVGTFLGVLLCYGFIGPIATNLEQRVHEEETFLTIIRMSLVAYGEGTHPILAVEAGRRAIPTRERPSFEELENEVRKWKSRTELS